MQRLDASSNGNSSSQPVANKMGLAATAPAPAQETGAIVRQSWSMQPFAMRGALPSDATGEESALPSDATGEESALPLDATGGENPFPSRTEADAFLGTAHLDPLKPCVKPGTPVVSDALSSSLRPARVFEATEPRAVVDRATELRLYFRGDSRGMPQVAAPLIPTHVPPPLAVTDPIQLMVIPLVLPHVALTHVVEHYPVRSMDASSHKRPKSIRHVQR